MNLARTSLAIAAVATTAVVAVLFISSSVVEAQNPPATTIESQEVDFNRLFAERFDSQFLFLEANVVYQSPTTIVIEGQKIRVQVGETLEESALVENEIIWQAVDIVKEHGYSIDAVPLSGQGTQANEHYWQVIMSK